MPMMDRIEAIRCIRALPQAATPVPFTAMIADVCRPDPAPLLAKTAASLARSHAALKNAAFKNAALKELPSTMAPMMRYPHGLTPICR